MYEITADNNSICSLFLSSCNVFCQISILVLTKFTVSFNFCNCILNFRILIKHNSKITHFKMSLAATRSPIEDRKWSIRGRIIEFWGNGLSVHCAWLRAPGAPGRCTSPRVRSHCRFRNQGTEHLSESGMKWMSGGAPSDNATEP